MLVAGLIYISIAFFPDPLKNGTNFPKQLLKLPTKRPSSLPWGPKPSPIEHLNTFFAALFLAAHIARTQHVSAEDGLYCPLQIKHLDKLSFNATFSYTSEINCLFSKESKTKCLRMSRTDEKVKFSSQNINLQVTKSCQLQRHAVS